MAANRPELELWDGYKMYISPDAYTFQPISASGANTEILTIDRVKGDVKLSASLGNDVSKGEKDKVMTVHGILGLIKLHSYEFLIVITSRTKAASLLTSTIYQATDFRVFPISNQAKPSLLQHPIEKKLLSLLKAHLYSAPFYFSYDYDLTSSMQRQATVGKNEPVWKRADERFFWNRHIQTRLINSCTSDSDLSRFILPVVMGFLEIKTCTLNGRDVIFGLIARRSRHRPGTRYFSRGLDQNGNVSNFNETEQFLVLDSKEENNDRILGSLRFSYVQTRGSVPVYWAEVNNLRYKPDLLIMNKPETPQATKAHFDQQVAIYGDVYLVNLVNQKGYEKPVKEAYEKAIESLDNNQVHYTYYDFHHECKGMKFEKVQQLIQRLQQKGLEVDDYFYQDIHRSNPNVRQQKAVVRTNCMDCLDRTNVVQSMLGRWVLNDQLRSAGVLSQDDKVENHNDFMFMFRNVWADHADTVSKAYSGTGALKTDFTRTGKRSTEGAIQDGINSITRYVKNNFFDGSRQDAYDLFSGAWEASGKTPHVDNRDLIVRAMPYVFFFSLLFIFAGLFLPRNSDSIPLSYFITFWILVTTSSFYFMVQRGLDYVDWPKLNRPEEAMFYDGPGYSSGRKGRAGVKGKYGRNSKAKYTEEIEIKNLNGGNRRGYSEKLD